MFTPRRFYIYAVSAVSLQAVATALIALVRNLIISGLDPARSTIALQIAIILIGMPLFLAHWLWGLRLARQAAEEQVAALRRLFLYAMLAAFLGPLVNSAYSILSRLLALVPGTIGVPRLHPDLPAAEFILYHLTGAFILAALWFYFEGVAAEESSPETDTGAPATVRRLYVFGFSAAGLVMLTIASVSLLQSVLFEAGAGPERAAGVPAPEIARLLVGGTVWLIHWRWAERLFSGRVREERESALRKFYLFSNVFLAALGTVTTLWTMLTSFFRRLLQVVGEPGDVREAIAILVPMVVLWAYHGLVLREDTRRAAESPQQAGVRRAYSYLVAGLGLSAVLTGLAGVLSALIFSLDEGTFGGSIRELLAWSTAALIVGLPVWGWPWRGAQARASSPEPQGEAERNSLARTIYLYFFLLVATMTVLSTVVFLVAQFLGTLLGEAAPGIAEIGTPMSLSAVAVAVWLYHGHSLRGDRRYASRALESRLARTPVAVVDLGQGDTGKSVATALERELPGIVLDVVSLPPQEKRAGEADGGNDVIQRLGTAGLIVSPWTAMVPGIVANPTFSRALIESPAQKLLYPTRFGAYEWAGVERMKSTELAKQVVRAAIQILQGDEVRPAKSLGVGTMMLIVVGIVLAMLLIGLPLASLFI